MNSELSASVEKKVFELILASPNVKITEVNSEMNLEAIKVDSLEALSVAMDLEDAFDVEITDEEVSDFKKVNDILACMDTKLLSKQDNPDEHGISTSADEVADNKTKASKVIG